MRGEPLGLHAAGEELTDPRCGDRGRHRLTGARVGPDAERERLTRGPARVECRRLRVRPRISVGAREDHEHHVGSFHGLPRDDGILREEATRVLDGRVVAHDLADDGLELIAVRLACHARLPVTTERHERIADQAGRRLVSLRHKTNPVGDDVLTIGAAHARDLSIEIAEQGRWARRASVQQRPKRVEQMLGRGVASRQLVARRRGSDAPREVADHGRGTGEHVRRHAEQAGEDVRGQTERELAHARGIARRRQLVDEVLRPPLGLLTERLLDARGRGRHRRLQRRVFRAVVHSYEASEDGAGR